MAINFTPADINVNTTRTLAYTGPTGKVGIIFSGVIANIDDTNKQDRFVTVEIQRTDNSYVKVFNKLVVPYGNSLALPKIVVMPDEKLYFTGDAASVLQARLSIAERS